MTGYFDDDDDSSNRQETADVLTKHHSKSQMPVGNTRLPDPRSMVEIRDSLEDESSETEMVRRSC